MRTRSVVPMAVVLVLVLAAGIAQTTVPQSAGTPAAQSASGGDTGAQPAPTRRRRRTRVHTADPTPPMTAAEQDQAKAAQQRLADQRLLSQQQARSQTEQQSINQLVQQKIAADRKVQDEVRIQDAPGPAQTGVVPGAPVQSLPQSEEPRIQDAPGPAQTIPSVPAPTAQTVPAPTTPAQTIPPL